MSKDLIAKVSTKINAPADRVWDALVNPEKVKRYMFGTSVSSSWHKGAAIVWKGEWKGKSYEDKGVILRIEPQRVLEYSHYSPLSGAPDSPENYHTVAIELTRDGAQTRVALTQDKNPTEMAKEHSEGNWRTMLESLKNLVENDKSMT